MLVTASVAGCIQDPAPPIGDNDVDLIVNSLEGYTDPFIRNHDHSLVENHKLAFHARQLSHHPLGGTALKSSGAHVVDIQNGYLFVGAYGLAADVDGGVYIFSLENPEEPQFTGVFRLPGNVGGDRSLEATDDGDWVVFGSESYDCANHVNPFAPGLFLIDARDKAAPTLAHYLPDPGVHSVIVHRIDGVDYAVTLGGDATTSGQNIFRIDTAAGKLVPVGSVPISHDGAAYDDPILGIPLLYIADTSNLNVYDWSVPATPKKVASWAPDVVKDADGNYINYVHAVAMDIVEGRRIVVAESENWGDKPSPMWVLDATDLSSLQLLATWTNPSDAPAHAGGENGPSLAFSTHNPRIEDGILYMAHYHAGIWIFDVRTLAKASAPEIMGYFLPHEDNGGYKAGSSQSAAPLPANPACFGGFKINEMPNVMDVEVQDGIVYGADLHTGLYAVKWDPTIVPGVDHGGH